LVTDSSDSRKASASALDDWHISGDGRKLAQTIGRSGRPKSAQRKSGISCTQGIPAGLPCGIPGMGEVIEGAMQHAPQFDRQSIWFFNHGFHGLARINPIPLFRIRVNPCNPW
jgi:hypothetical protein